MSGAPRAKSLPVFVWILPDERRGKALITGVRFGSALHRADLYDVAVWSRSRRGFVIPLDRVPDLTASCEHEGIPCRTREPKCEEKS